MNQVIIEFEKVISTKVQTETLFDLLKERPHRISYVEIDYVKHQNFVNEHPYRSWYLIKIKDTYVGSFYVSKENMIGINVFEKYTRQAVFQIVRFIRDNYIPLPEIPSVRSGLFAINVPPLNILLAEVLENLNAELVQKTYLFPSTNENDSK
jgi:hypothetical protein